jgi:hypothetical protein
MLQVYYGNNTYLGSTNYCLLIVQKMVPTSCTEIILFTIFSRFFVQQTNNSTISNHNEPQILFSKSVNADDTSSSICGHGWEDDPTVDSFSVVHQDLLFYGNTSWQVQ